MTTDEFRTLTRKTVLAIDKTDPAGVEEAVAPLRAALAERGLSPNCHLGGGRQPTQDEVVEWYAGQLLDIVDTQAWESMNAAINFVDKFCPESTSP